MVYLLHFARHHHRARHYLGCTNNLPRRLAQHRAGHGARLVAAVLAAGIEFECVRTWEGGFPEERRLKRFKAAPRFCPVCQQMNREAQR